MTIQSCHGTYMGIRLDMSESIANLMMKRFGCIFSTLQIPQNHIILYNPSQTLKMG